MAKITLSKALDAFSRELSCSSVSDRDILLDSIQENLEWALHNGADGLLREWTVVARNGRFVLPRDLEVPVKYKFEQLPNLGYGIFNTPFVSYGSQGIKTADGFFEWNNQIQVNVNKVPVQFHPPKCGVRVIITSLDHRDVGKNIMIGGKQRGFDVMGTHNGIKTAGELLTVYHQKDPEKKYSSYYFDEITSITKDLTCDYVLVSGIDKEGEIYHLAHLHPDDEYVSYTECEVLSGHGYRPGCDFKLHIIGRVNPSMRYIRDEDALPITSTEILRLLAKRARYDETADYNELALIEQRLRMAIKKQVTYQQKANIGISMHLKSSGASLTNM